MGFVWSSGAEGLPAPLLSSRLRCESAAEAAIRRADARAFAPGHGPRHVSASGRYRLRGEDPVDVAAPWPFTAALRDLGARRRALASEDGSLRTLDRSARQNFRTAARDPPDLDAVCHDASRSLRPSRQAGFPLMGLSKDRPSVVQAAESDSRDRPVRRLRLTSRSLRDERATPIRLPSSWSRTTSTGCSSLDPATVLQAAADPGVHRVSFRRETEFPAMLLLPSEAFPPPTATFLRNESRIPVGPRHRLDRCRPVRSPRTLPPRPFLPRRSRIAVSCVPFRGSFLLEAGTSGPCSVVGSVARSAVSGRACPVLPWACPPRPWNRSHV